MYKIALNAGHGLNTAGKRCLKSLDPKETREWTLNSRICNLIEQKLKDYTGYELIRLDDTTGKTDVALSARTKKANNFKADFYLSIHHNAGVKGGSGGGVVAITYLKVDSLTTDYQTALYNEIIKLTGLKGNRAAPLQKQDLHECRESNMPCVLLECGFMDSKTDVPIILTDDFANTVATACVNVLVSKGKLTKKVEAPVIDTQPTASSKKSVEEIAREVIAGKYGDGHAVRKPKIEAEGYNYEEVRTMVNKLMGVSTVPKVSYYPRYNGTTVSIVTALNSIGVASSFANRKKIAKANGINTYLGTAAQNTKLLNLLKQGKLIKY